MYVGIHPYVYMYVEKHTDRHKPVFMYVCRHTYMNLYLCMDVGRHVCNVCMYLYVCMDHRWMDGCRQN